MLKAKNLLRLPLILLILFFIIINLKYLDLPLDRDEGAYAYIGWSWFQKGLIPYQDTFDHKPPLVYLTYGLATLLSDNTSNNYYSLRIFSLFYKGLLITLFFVFVRKLVKLKSTVLLTFTLIFYLSSVELQSVNFTTEILVLLPSFLFVYWIYTSDSQKNAKQFALTFSLASLSYLIRPTEVLATLLIFIFCVTQKSKRILSILLGLSVPIIVTIFYFLLNNGLNSYFEDVIAYNRLYVIEGLNLEAISYFFGGGSLILGLFQWLIHTPLVIAPLFLTALISLLVTYQKRDRFWVISALYLLSSWLSIKVGGVREFNHYYILLIIPSLLALIPLIKNLKTLREKISFNLLVILLICFVIFLEKDNYFRSVVPEILVSEYGQEGDLFYDAVILSHWIKDNTDKDDQILVWANEPEIYFYIKKTAPTPYINFYGLTYQKYQYQLFLHSFNTRSIDWIITYANPIDQILPFDLFLKTHPEFKLHLKIDHYLIFKRSKTS